MTTDVAVASVRTTRLPRRSAVWWHLRTWLLPSVIAPWLHHPRSTAAGRRTRVADHSTLDRRRARHATDDRGLGGSTLEVGRLVVHTDCRGLVPVLSAGQSDGRPVGRVF